jgi:hypothetical protein
MRVPAFYYAPRSRTNPIFCEVRVHTKQAELGDLKGTSFNYAETAEVIPKIIFWHTEFTPHQGGCFLVGQDEVYRIGVLEPIDGPTQTAQVALLGVPEARTFVMP